MYPVSSYKDDIFLCSIITDFYKLSVSVGNPVETTQYYSIACRGRVAEFQKGS